MILLCCFEHCSTVGRNYIAQWGLYGRQTTVNIDRINDINTDQVEKELMENEAT